MATDLRSLTVEFPVLFSATVRTAIAPMHGEPRIASQMISQQVAGHRVEIVDQEGDWVRARGADGYEGWMHLGFLARAPEPGARQSHNLVSVSLGCVARAMSGERRRLPLRAVLAPDETVDAGEAIDASLLAERFPLDARAITRSAQELFTGTSYLWGGVTPWAADCSGLVQSVFALHGRQLPRDAWQQSEQGGAIEAGRDFTNLAEADLLFFSDRPDARVTHVGISLGAQRMVHLSLARGGYSVEQLDAQRDAVVERLRQAFLFARRVI